MGRYHEPFLGSGAILGTLAPHGALASDSFGPLMEIWVTLKTRPDIVKAWYGERWALAHGNGKKEGYASIRDRYNRNPNGADLLFLTRSCYGGVVRFRKTDGHMSTPCGGHEPITPERFEKRADMWHERVRHADFATLDYREAMQHAKKGDFIYCDPPYAHSQPILYGGHAFRLDAFFEEIGRCKARGVHVAVSLDGTKKSGRIHCDLPIPKGLFAREIFIPVGRSMLRRFQMEGSTLESEVVCDRLLLTYMP